VPARTCCLPRFTLAPQVLQQLEQAKHVPDFNNYLSFIFSKGDNLPMEVRGCVRACVRT
jgi:hypothetical protein